jgi:L-iditol 2-dehydrogenase
VAVHALKRGGDVKGKKVLVLGAGPIGNLVGQAAKGMGAESVIITDLSEFRLDVAQKCGIDFCLNIKNRDLGKALIGYFGKDKADLILDCAGTTATIGQGIENARKGSDIIVVAVFAENATVDMGLVQDRELRIIGTLMYREEDYKTAIELIIHGKVKLKPLITNRFTFRDYLKAYEFIEEMKDMAMKVMIDVQGDK